jgi:hypothetical protein
MEIQVRTLSSSLLAVCLFLSGCPFGKSDTQRALNDVDSALALLADLSAKWQDTLKTLETNLARDAQTTLANEVDVVLQRGISASGAELRCDADFIRNRIVQQIQNVKAQLLKKQLTPIIPSICQVVPSVIDLRLSADRRSAISFVGYDMDISQPMKLTVWLLDRDGSERDVTGALAIPDHYLMTLNIAQNGVDFQPTSNKIALRWGKAELGTVSITRDPEPFRPKLFTSVAPVGPNPTVTASVPDGYQLVGGGCRSEWAGAGQLLYASYPSANSWICGAKSHAVPDDASLTAFAVAVPKSLKLEVQIAFKESQDPPASGSSAHAQLPLGYSVIGGGCKTSWQAPQPGHYIVYSFPVSDGWICEGHDHDVASPGKITAYAIGLNSTTLVTVTEIPVTGPSRQNGRNDVTAPMPPLDSSIGIVGGGCQINYSGDGQFLTASWPNEQSQQWVCTSKDHSYASPATVTSFPIGLRWNKP